MIARRPLRTNNFINNGVTCYKCNNFGHMAGDCRLQVNHKGPRYGNSIVTCYNCNNLDHAARYWRFNGFVNNIRSPNITRNNNIRITQYECIDNFFVKEGNIENIKVQKEEEKTSTKNKGETISITKPSPLT